MKSRIHRDGFPMQLHSLFRRAACFPYVALCSASFFIVCTRTLVFFVFSVPPFPFFFCFHSPFSRCLVSGPNSKRKMCTATGAIALDVSRRELLGSLGLFLSSIISLALTRVPQFSFSDWISRVGPCFPLVRL